ncbi:MAG: HD domain-containing protein [Candidatus Riflebacteria bacterium]|nr:HD domain-containing protein [Candidatus Riflebacteria bacterium]
MNIILAALLIWLTCKYFDLKKTLKPTEKRYSELVDALASIVDRVEGYDNAHAKEVAELAVKIAGRTSITSEQISSLETAAKLHDVGMLMISNDIIKSRRKLSDDNAFIMKNHPLLAEHYLKQEVSINDNIPTIIRWHHERWDGFGYPDSLRGEQIPVLARILSIADSISAMRSSRSYRKRNYKSDKEIIDELKRQSGLQFDPALVKIAVSILEENTSDQG